MNIKDLIRKIPYSVQLYKAITIPTRNRKILKQLSDTPYPQGTKLREALELLEQELPQSEQNWITRIEDERKHLLSRDELLNDGSLGEGGLYDNGETIKSACEVSKPPKPALMLYLLTRAIKPQCVIELGTNVGISSAYIGAALKVNGDNGKLTTLEVSPYRLRLAKEVHSNLSIDNISYVEGLFMDTLSEAVDDMGSIDLAFIDGHHQYQPTLDYFEELLRFASTDAVFVFDDIDWSDGMNTAWSKIQSDNNVGLAVDLSSVGICVRHQETISRHYVLPPLHLF